MLVLILADKVRHLYVFAGYPTHMWVCEQKQGCKKNRHPVVWKNMFPSMSIKYVYVYIYIYMYFWTDRPGFPKTIFCSPDDDLMNSTRNKKLVKWYLGHKWCSIFSGISPKSTVNCPWFQWSQDLKEVCWFRNPETRRLNTLATYSWNTVPFDVATSLMPKTCFCFTYLTYLAARFPIKIVFMHREIPERPSPESPLKHPPVVLGGVLGWQHVVLHPNHLHFALVDGVQEIGVVDHVAGVCRPEFSDDRYELWNEALRFMHYPWFLLSFIWVKNMCCIIWGYMYIYIIYIYIIYIYIYICMYIYIYVYV